jgi:hypothetical protein
MIKLLNILSEIVVQKDPILQKIADYVRGGSKGNLDLTGTPIQSLPPGLKVGGDLYLDGTSIQSLPPGLKVGGNLYLRYTPISKNYTKEEIRKMVPGVEGHIFRLSF